MPKTLSIDLRERIVRHVSEGHSRRSAAVKLPFGQFAGAGRRREATGSAAPGFGPPRRLLARSWRTIGDDLIRRIAKVPASPCRNWLQSSPTTRNRIDPSSCRAGSSGSATASKTLLASEQDLRHPAGARGIGRQPHQPNIRLERHRLVFIDETGTNTKMTRLRGRSPEGQRQATGRRSGTGRPRPSSPGCDATA